MNKYYTILICILAFCCWQCNDEDSNVGPSGEDKNWYIVYPSDDPLDRLIYEVYENHHVPIFYNDTIGREKKVDRFGQEWVSYEILDPNYTIESVMASVKYVLSRDREKLKTGVEFLCDGVLERLPEIVQPKCFLFVDSVYLRGAGSVSWNINWIPGTMYRGAGCTVIGIDTLCKMSEDEKLTLTYNIIGEEFGAYLRYNYADTLNAFYRYSNNSVLTGSAYGVRISNYDSEAVGDAYWKEFGFLNCSYGTFSYWDLPEDFPAAMPDFYSYLTSSQQEDVRDFVVAILTMTDEQFEEENGRYPVVMHKYEVLKGIVRTLMNE